MKISSFIVLSIMNNLNIIVGNYSIEPIDKRSDQTHNLDEKQPNNINGTMKSIFRTIKIEDMAKIKLWHWKKIKLNIQNRWNNQLTAMATHLT